MPEEKTLDCALKSAMRELTTAFSKPVDLEQALTRVTATAVDLIDGVDYADVMLVDSGNFRSMASTASLVVDLDHTQMNHGQGPCLEAAVADSVVRSVDLRHEQRWPAFASAAIDFGVLSVLSFQLYTHHEGAGALNLLSRRSHAFDIKAETALAMLATHAAITLIAADRETQFQSALASRDIIGQAKGIVMERFTIDAGRAFALIAKLSQDSNIPVRQVAQRLVSSTHGRPSTV